MAEESRLEQLAAGARRQRELNHWQLVEYLLKERRALRAKILERQHQEDQEELAYNQLRSEIHWFTEGVLVMPYASC